MGRYEVFRQYKTLEVGFKPKLIEAIHNSELFAENSVYIIEMFLRRYTKSSLYMKNALKFKTRYNLEGEEVCPISAKDLAYFDKVLKAHNRSNAGSSTEKLNTKKDRRNSKRPINSNRPIITLKKKPKEGL